MNDFTEQNFLTALKNQCIPCVIIFTNGYQMRGAEIFAVDRSSLWVWHEGTRQMVYRHAISTIRPMRFIDFAEHWEDAEDTRKGER